MAIVYSNIKSFIRRMEYFHPFGLLIVRFTFLLSLSFLLSLTFTISASAQTIGNTTTGTATYPTTAIGDNTIRTGTVSITTNIVQAVNKISVTGPLTITSVSIYISGSYSGHNMKFAVYPDNGGSPAGQVLTGQTGGYSFTTATGWVNINLNSADYIYIPATGTYWLCFMGDASAGQVRRVGNGGATDYYFTQTYGVGYPATFPSNSTAETVGTYSFYAAGVKIKGYSKASKAILPVNGSFSSLSFYSHAAGSVRLSIYNDANGTPSAKQWESGDITINSTGQPKWTTVNISSGIPASLILNSGTYWLAWQWNNTTLGPSYTAGSVGDGNYMIQSPYGSFPANWSGGTVATEKWSIYATYCATPATPAVTSQVTYCLNAIPGQLTATGTGLLWYTLPSGGSGSGTAPTPVTTTPGTTSYYVSQTVNCEGPRARIDVVVTSNPLPIASVISQTNLTCYGVNTGEITIKANGGTVPYTFSINNGSTYPGSGNSSYQFSNLPAGNNYKIRVKDNVGCESPAIP